jgi:hypothetical protein
MGRKAKAQIHNRECALSRQGPPVMMIAPTGSSGFGFVEKCFVEVCEVARTENTRRSCNFI